MNTDKLFDLAFQYKKTGLWNHMIEDQLFAIPLSGDRIGYVSIMGLIGEHCAIVLYIGEEGLRNYHTLRSDKFQFLSETDYNPALMHNECLQAVFDSKDYLTEDEIEAARTYARNHNIKIAGKNAYPHFLKYESGFIPRPVDSSQDIEDLINALEAALSISSGPIVNGFDYRDFARIDQESSEIVMVNATNCNCSISMISLPSVPEHTPAIGTGYDALAVKRLSRLPHRNVLQAGLMTLPFPSAWDGSDHAVMPVSLCMVDDKTGLAIPVQPVALYETRTNIMLNKLMEALQEADFVPKKIKVCDEYTEALLREWCHAMGIKLSVSKDKLPELEEFKSGMYHHAAGGSYYDDIEEMLDELLERSPEEIARLYDVLSTQIFQLAEETEKMPDVPLSLKYKLIKVKASFNAVRETGHVDYLKQQADQYGRPFKRKNSKTGRKNGTAASGKRHREQSVVISVSLGTGCYRHIRLSDRETLYQFADYILQAFDFFNDHAHAFFMDNRIWSEEDCYYISGIESYFRTTEKTPLYRTGLYVGKKFKFVFDFGDEWVFQCKVLKIEDETKVIPEVIRSKGEAPLQYRDWDDDWDE